MNMKSSEMEKRAFRLRGWGVLLAIISGLCFGGGAVYAIAVLLSGATIVYQQGFLGLVVHYVIAIGLVALGLMLAPLAVDLHRRAQVWLTSARVVRIDEH